ncbi:MAG: GDP-fucose protein O-fucosyltransferase [Herbinix sp.]|jgi:hypothetical protein|nr:GDP-fucose protein O-fucosyltransferase [Herbinix sp.]
MPEDKYLLIKAISHDIWKNVNHLMELLLVAELTGRKPVVYWGTNCLYKEVIHNNAFDLYFESISPYTIYDVISIGFTYFPPMWKYDNLTSDDPDKAKRMYRNIGDIMGSDANVVVSDSNIYVSRVIPFITKNHPAYGMTPQQIYRYLFNKYLKLKPDIDKEIQQFYDKNFKNAGHVLAVHMPGDFTLDIYPQIQEYNNLMLYHPRNLNSLTHPKKLKDRTDNFLVDDTIYLHEIVRLLKVTQQGDPYKLFHPEIRSILGKFNIDKIFLITDREDILEEYSKLYGSMLVYTKCERVPKNDAHKVEHLENHLNKRSKGIEILKDTYLAAKCDFFLGYGFSNLSHGVTHLKDWSDTNIKLTYWMYEKLYNFSYGLRKTGRNAPEEADGKYRLMTKIVGNSMKRVRRVFK